MDVRTVSFPGANSTATRRLSLLEEYVLIFGHASHINVDLARTLSVLYGNPSRPLTEELCLIRITGGIWLKSNSHSGGSLQLSIGEVRWLFSFCTLYRVLIIVRSEHSSPD